MPKPSKTPCATTVDPSHPQNNSTARDIYHKEMNDLIQELLQPSPLYQEQRFNQHKKYAKGLSMLNLGMLQGLVQQVEHVVDAGVHGDVFEFGSWRGGASILMARAFVAYERVVRCEAIGGKEGSHGGSNRTFWVFDTFSGFSSVQVENDSLLQDILLDDYWVAPLEKVKASFISFTTEEFVKSNVQFVPGLFDEVLPMQVDQIALLRLDGDLYESTKVVMDSMYSSVARGGQIIVDDYDWRPEKWATRKDYKTENITRRICKHAVDDFRRERNITTHITRQYGRPSWTKESEL